MHRSRLDNAFTKSSKMQKKETPQVNHQGPKSCSVALREVLLPFGTICCWIDLAFQLGPEPLLIGRKEAYDGFVSTITVVWVSGGETELGESWAIRERDEST